MPNLALGQSVVLSTADGDAVRPQLSVFVAKKSPSPAPLSVHPKVASKTWRRQHVVVVVSVVAVALTLVTGWYALKQGKRLVALEKELLEYKVQNQNNALISAQQDRLRQQQDSMMTQRDSLYEALKNQYEELDGQCKGFRDLYEKQKLIIDNYQSFILSLQQDLKWMKEQFQQLSSRTIEHNTGASAPGVNSPRRIN